MVRDRLCQLIRNQVDETTCRSGFWSENCRNIVSWRWCFRHIAIRDSIVGSTQYGDVFTSLYICSEPFITVYPLDGPVPLTRQARPIGLVENRLSGPIFSTGLGSANQINFQDCMNGISRILFSNTHICYQRCK